MTILDRYVAKELLGPFLFGLATFTILFVASGPLFEIARLIVLHGVPPFLALQFLLYKMPAILVLTTPMATLLASILAFGRLSGENEIVALKAGGIHFSRVMAPALVFALVVSLLTAWVNDRLVTRANLLAGNLKQTRIDMVPLRIQNVLIHTTTPEGIERFTFALEFDEQANVLKTVSVLDFSRQTLLRMTTAEKAVWDGKSWRFENGVVHNMDKWGRIDFESQFLSAYIDIPRDPRLLARSQRRMEELSREELRQEIANLLKVKLERRKLREALWEYHVKYSIPFASLVFVTIGAPFALRPHRTSSSLGIGMSLVLILIYYISMTLCATLGTGDFPLLPAAILAWLPNVLFTLIGLGLIVRASK
ncbi:MAG: LptF/LptG family permease [Armatimonadetes bacterium]|nr:LptF/LptG family permease [Armatimonadota bacterium]